MFYRILLSVCTVSAKNPLLTTLPRGATIKCNETVDAGVKTAVHAQRVWIAESQAERKLLNGPRRAQGTGGYFLYPPQYSAT